MRIGTALQVILSLALTLSGRQPSRDWQTRYREFERIAEQPPYPPEVESRLVQLLEQENELTDALDEAGAIGSLGEGFGEYVSDLSQIVYRFAKRGNMAAVRALIRSPHAPNSEIAKFLAENHWRDYLSYLLSLNSRRRIGWGEAPETIGIIYGLQSAAMEPELRRRIEQVLLESLQAGDYLRRESAIIGIRRAKLKAALPLLRERAEKLRAEIQAGGRPPEFELKWLAGSIEALEKLP